MNQIVLVIFLLVFACSCSSGAKEVAMESSLKEDTLAADTLTDENLSQADTSMTIYLNKNNVRKRFLSMSHMSTEIRSYLFGPDSMTVEQLLEMDITTRNNNGELITFPLKEVVDSIK